MTLSIECRKHLWAVYEDGERVSREFLKASTAQDELDRLMEVRGHRRRPCLCCGTSFMSEGIHNRMCDRCRRYGAGLDNQMVS